MWFIRLFAAHGSPACFSFLQQFGQYNDGTTAPPEVIPNTGLSSGNLPVPWHNRQPGFTIRSRLISGLPARALFALLVSHSILLDIPGVFPSVFLFLRASRVTD